MGNAVQRVTVPLLGTSTIGDKFGTSYDASLPTLVVSTRSAPRLSCPGLSSLMWISVRASTCRSSRRSTSPRRSSWGRRKAGGWQPAWRRSPPTQCRASFRSAPRWTTRASGVASWGVSVANAEDEVRRFVNAADTELRVVEGRQHFLSASNPDEVSTATLEFINRWKQQTLARWLATGRRRPGGLRGFRVRGHGRR